MSIVETGIDDIDLYCDQVLNEKIPSCEYIKQAVQRFQDDLDKAENDPDFDYYFEPKACEHFFNFVEGHLKHFQSPFAGEPFILEPWQKWLTGQLFGWLKKEKFNGQHIRRFRTANIFIAKKSGKSILGAAIALYALLYEGGGTEIYGLAMNRNHAKKLSFNTAVQMVKKSPELQELFKVNESIASLAVKCPETSSFFEPIASNADTIDGPNPSIVINDEVKDSTDFKLYDTLIAGMVTRLSPLALNISSSGYRTDTVGYELYKNSIEILKGDIKDNTTLAVIYGIDKGDTENWDDEDVWRKANPNYGVSILPTYVEQRINDGKRSNRVKNDILIKNLNVFGKSDEGFINISDWDKCRDDIEMKDLKHLPAILTLDLASKQDLTNVKLTFYEGETLDDLTLYPFDYFYAPESRLSRENTTDKYLDSLIGWNESGELLTAGQNTLHLKTVQDKILELHENFNITHIAYDPWNSESSVQRLKGTIPEHKFIEYTQTGFKNWDQPMQTFESMVLDQRIVHPGNDLLRWNIENLRAKKNEYEAVRPTKQNDSVKIDGAVTLIMALGVWIWTREEKDSSDTQKVSPYVIRALHKKKERGDDLTSAEQRLLDREPTNLSPVAERILNQKKEF